MAFPNKTIFNRKTGQAITFLQTGKETGGSLLEMEASFNPHSKEPAPHYHPHQAEDFTILKGELTVRVDGKLKTLRQGDTLHVPINTVHSMWNHSDEITVINWKVQPALNTDQFLETAIGIANNGRTDKNGMPSILQVALLANKYNKVFRLAKPSFTMQKLVFTLLAPFAYLLGYRSTYKKYID